jgi:hypothetical protein
MIKAFQPRAWIVVIQIAHIHIETTVHIVDDLTQSHKVHSDITNAERVTLHEIRFRPGLTQSKLVEVNFTKRLAIQFRVLGGIVFGYAGFASFLSLEFLDFRLLSSFSR